jgi:uncharacterized membrane protein YoaT (DUF817 family)
VRLLFSLFSSNESTKKEELSMEFPLILWLVWMKHNPPSYVILSKYPSVEQEVWIHFWEKIPSIGKVRRWRKVYVQLRHIQEDSAQMEESAQEEDNAQTEE